VSLNTKFRLFYLLMNCGDMVPAYLSVVLCNSTWCFNCSLCRIWPQSCVADKNEWDALPVTVTDINTVEICWHYEEKVVLVVR